MYFGCKGKDKTLRTCVHNIATKVFNNNASSSKSSSSAGGLLNQSYQFTEGDEDSKLRLSRSNNDKNVTQQLSAKLTDARSQAIGYENIVAPQSRY